MFRDFTIRMSNPQLYPQRGLQRTPYRRAGAAIPGPSEPDPDRRTAASKRSAQPEPGDLAGPSSYCAMTESALAPKAAEP